MNETLAGRVVSLGAAERARTLVASATEVRMGICDLTHEVPRHVVDGSLLILAAHLSPGLDDSVDVRPLALDRFGLSLRLYAEQGHRDVRVGFTRPVACGCDVRRTFADLWRRIAPGDPGLQLLTAGRRQSPPG